MLKAEIVMEEKEIHMLKQYSHIYLFALYTLSNLRDESMRKGRERAECENVIFLGEVGTSVSNSK